MEVRPSLDQILDVFQDDYTKSYIETFVILTNNSYAIKGPTLKGLTENKTEYILTKNKENYTLQLTITKKNSFYDVLELDLKMKNSKEEGSIFTKLNFDTGEISPDMEMTNEKLTPNLKDELLKAYNLLVKL